MTRDRLTRRALCVATFIGIALTASGCIGFGSFWGGGGGRHSGTSTAACGPELTGPDLLRAIDKGACRYTPQR